MLKPFPFTKASPLCLQCQYRLAGARRRGADNLIRGLGQSRHQSQAQQQAQEQAPNNDSNPSTRYHVGAPSNTTDHDYRPGLQFAERSIMLHRKDALGVDSLGRPADILVMTTPERQREATIHVEKLDRRNKEPAPGSADEMLEKIKEEQGIPSGRGIAQNMEALRDTWISKRKWKGRPLSLMEYENLAGKLELGFTAKQLMGYYVQVGSNVPVDPADLDQPFATALYTRSAWTLGTTTFPGDATHRLKVCKSSAQSLAFTEAVTATGRTRIYSPVLKALTTKRAVVERILRECWQLKMARDEEAMGELEIWTQSERNHLLLNHDQDILRRIAERYGAKIDTSRSHDVIRITADRGTCDDILNLLLYVFRSIKSAEVDIVPARGEASRAADRLAAALDPKYRGEIQQLTNTIIQPSLSGGEDRSQSSHYKAIIYYMGPSNDDFLDARRLLSQSSQSSPDDSSVHWGYPTHDVAIVPVAVDVGVGLPLAHRTQQWSRWTSPTKGSKGPPRRRPLNVDRSLRNIHFKTAQKAYKTRGILGNLVADTSDADLHCWPDVTSQTSSLMPGHLLYPTKVVGSLNVATRGSSDRKFSPPFLRTLRSSRQFLMGSIGLDPLRELESNTKLRYVEDLRVLLTVQAQDATPSDDLSRKPNLEILIAIDREERTTRLASVRLIFATRHCDLVLPAHQMDLRFSTEQQAIAKSSIMLLPAIQTFLAESNFDIWGTERLKTPPTLKLSIPKYSFHRSSQQSSGDEADSSSVTKTCSEHTEYEFASLEHRASLGHRSGDLDVLYSVIEAGRTGGRREGLQLCAQSPLTDKVGSNMIRLVNSMIEESMSNQHDDDSDIDATGHSGNQYLSWHNVGLHTAQAG